MSAPADESPARLSTRHFCNRGLEQPLAPMRQLLLVVPLQECGVRCRAARIASGYGSLAMASLVAGNDSHAGASHDRTARAASLRVAGVIWLRCAFADIDVVSAG